MTPSEHTVERISRSSIEIVRNSKGFSYTVKVYAGDTDVAEVLAALRQIVPDLDREYPREGVA